MNVELLQQDGLSIASSISRTHKMCKDVDKALQHHWVCWLLLFGSYEKLQTWQCSPMLSRSHGTRCSMREGGSDTLGASCRAGSTNWEHQKHVVTTSTCLACILDLTWDLMQMNPESNKRLLHHVAMKMESRSCAHSMTMWSNMFFLVCEAFFELQWVFVGTVWDREFLSDGAIAASRGCQSASPDRRATRLNVYPGSAQLLKI